MMARPDPTLGRSGAPAAIAAQNGTVANITERGRSRDTVCCCVPVKRDGRAVAYDAEEEDPDDEEDAGAEPGRRGDRAPGSMAMDRRGRADVRIDVDAVGRAGRGDGGGGGEPPAPAPAASAPGGKFWPLHPVSVIVFADTAVRKLYYDVRRFVFIAGSVMYNDKDNDERQLYFGKAEALLRRMRALTGARPESPLVERDDTDMVMRSVSSVIVSAARGTDGGPPPAAAEPGEARPRTAPSAVAMVAGAAGAGRPFSDAKIRQIQIRWRLRRAKRMLEKISAEKILGEIAMSQFNLDEEYGELMMVSGFVWILAAVFPLAPLLACLSCYVIIRGCTMKLLVSCRRPWPMKRYDIGSWCAAPPAGRAPHRMRLGSAAAADDPRAFRGGPSSPPPQAHGARGDQRARHLLQRGVRFRNARPRARARRRRPRSPAQALTMSSLRGVFHRRAGT